MPIGNVSDGVTSAYAWPVTDAPPMVVTFTGTPWSMTVPEAFRLVSE